MQTKTMWSGRKKAFLFIFGILFLLLTGYLLLSEIINRKIRQSFKKLPPGIVLKYSSLHTNLVGSTITINDLIVKYLPENNELHQNDFSFNRVTVSGINFFKIIFSKELVIRKISLENGNISLDRFLLDKKNPLPDIHIPFKSLMLEELELTDMNASTHIGQQEDFLFEGNLAIEKIKIDRLNMPVDENNFEFAEISCTASKIKYVIPEAYESVQIKDMILSSKDSSLHIDTCRIVPLVNKFQIGEKKGFQVDFIESLSSGIDMEKLDVVQFLHKKIVVGKISVRQNHIYVFRDRRLPLQTETKPLPVDYFKTLPVIRAQAIAIGATTFIYEEFPKEGRETGMLKILHGNISISPFITQPSANDPANINIKMEGSLMGSGTVKATMQLPLKKGNDYVVEGAFKDLDLTTLNASAENLGRIHIESGLLNNLTFQFSMNEEKSKGKIVGEYHNLVIDKLKTKGEEKKVDRFKTFFVKHFIIPKNKDKSMDESKRTGEVSFKRDLSRYFSYYLLHSLLTGVKSSFSLGFLLPG